MDADRAQPGSVRWRALGAAWGRALGADAVLALAVATVAVMGSAPAGAHQEPAPAPMDWVGYALVLVGPLALAVRRIRPVLTLALAATATATYLLLNYPYGPVLFAPVIAVYTVASRLPARRAAMASALAAAALLIHVFVGERGLPGYLGVAPVAAFVVVPFAVGTTVRLGREAEARSRTDEVRRRADAERLRVAQEVHDVVGHGLAAIHMQAEIALHLLPKRPEQARAALTVISRTSKEALDELRVTLAVVRRGDDRTPTPGLADLDSLVARLAGVGVPVRVEVSGAPRELPTAVDLAAYRVVQESLTNVLRHAGGAAAVVRVEYAPDAVRVEVTDRGSGAGSGLTGDGHGIAGMRERVTAQGGEFAAGVVAGGGFRVYASLPVAS